MDKQKKEKLYRKVTDIYYTNTKMMADEPNSFLPIEISEKPYTNYTAKNMDEDLWYINPSAKIGPMIGGGGTLFIITSFFFRQPTSDNIIASIVFYASCLIFITCVLYYFTMPKKELIFDRKHGTMTFPGSLWNKNITMPFDKIKFCISTGGHNVVGAGKLELVKPETLPKRYPIGFWGSYSEDLSFITWYMDRNRPLPPGELFDPFRERDFERRKAEGFPPPLYPSKIKTPEATPEQQKEREKYWKDSQYWFEGTATKKKKTTTIADRWAERN